MRDDRAQIIAHNKDQIAESKDVAFIPPPPDDIAKVWF